MLVPRVGLLEVALLDLGGHIHDRLHVARVQPAGVLGRRHVPARQGAMISQSVCAWNRSVQTPLGSTNAALALFETYEYSWKLLEELPVNFSRFKVIRLKMEMHQRYGLKSGNHIFSVKIVLKLVFIETMWGT